MEELVVAESAPPARRAGFWSDALFALALVAALFLAYRPAWRGALLWDDDRHLPAPARQSLSGLRQIWFELRATPQYYPVVYSVFWLEHRIWGDDTLGYHLTSLALHAASALIVLRIVRQLAIPGAYLAAAVFALHPVQVESAAWISELKNTLSGVFYLGALSSCLAFDRRRSPTTYCAALALFVMAILSKTAVATLPAAVLVILWWRRGRLCWRRDALPLAPFFALALAGGVLSAWMERSVVGAQGAEFGWTWLEAALIAGRAVWFYVGKLCWPSQLTFIYPRWEVSQSVWRQYLFPLAAAGVLAVFWKLRRRSRAPLAAALFFGGTLFPALGFLNVYPFRYSFVADHFQYLACLGVIVPASAGAAWLLNCTRRPWIRMAGSALCVGGLAILATLTWQQSRMYADAETLYRDTIARNPDCWLAFLNLSKTLAAEGRAEEALQMCEMAVRLNPDSPEARNDLSGQLSGAGRIAEALAHADAALRSMPTFAGARYNRAIALAKAGRIAEALEDYRRALRLDPRLTEAYSNLGVLLLDQNRADEATDQFRQALRINPAFVEARNNLGNALLRLGRVEESIAEYRQALRLRPELAATRFNLSLALARVGRAEESLAEGERALQSAEAAHNRALAEAIERRLREFRHARPAPR